jgi:hypothetical protein
VIASSRVAFLEGEVIDGVVDAALTVKLFAIGVERYAIRSRRFDANLKRHKTVLY